MLTVWLKAVHIASLVIWCGGVLVLPILFAYRPAVGDKVELWHLQRITRFAYVVLISPAAFAAVVSGTLLVFVQDVFTVWFALKLLAVGLLALLHIRFGHVIIGLFKEGASYGKWRMQASILLGIGVITTILLLVLWKPDFDLGALPDWMLQPGGLQSASPIMIPIP